MRKRSGQVHSRESSATLQLTVSLLYLLEERNFRNEKSMVQYFRSYQRDKWIIEKEQNKSHVG